MQLSITKTFDKMTDNLKLRFTGDSVANFDLFLKCKYQEAGGYLDRDNVKREELTIGVLYTVTLIDQYIYQIGYDWALWQFPPKD